jgi:hypothetical protein
MVMVQVAPMPDVEMALLYALVPMEPDVRFVTIMPADIAGITARIKRVSGGGSRGHAPWWMDQPVVDVDVWGPFAAPSGTSNVSQAARNIQADIVSLMGIPVLNGVIQQVTTVSGPRQLPEVNKTLVRYNASYEIRIHP